MSLVISAPSAKSIPPCPKENTGVHIWLLSAANILRHQGQSPEEALSFLRAHITRQPDPPQEIEQAIKKAFDSQPFSPSSATRTASGPRPVPLSKIEFSPELLKKATASIARPRNWRHWLWERSPKRPDAMDWQSFLSCLYHPGEKVAIFDKFQAWKPLEIVTIGQAPASYTNLRITQGGSGEGIWYLCAPVDGEWHPTGEQWEDGRPKTSCRSKAAVTEFRFAVLESDEADADDWLALLAKLSLPISAIYTSGGKSIHALWRVNASSKDQWSATVEPFKRQLKHLGADPAALSGVRLTRLPGCPRPLKGGFQKLLFINPSTNPSPLRKLPIIETRAAFLTRWRQTRPANQDGFE